MYEIFDHNHDGKLSFEEEMERDYVINEMFLKDDHDEPGSNISYRSSSSGAGSAIPLGVLLLIIGFSALAYFPIFAIIVLVLGFSLVTSS